MDLQIFLDLQDRLDGESAVRESITNATRELHKSCRMASAKLSKAHAQKQSTSAAIVESATEEFGKVKETIHTISELITPVSFYKYHDMWSSGIQSACSLVTFAVYIKESRLATPEDVAQYLGVPVNIANKNIDAFCVTLDEYLHGIINLFNELSRLAVNSVIVGDVERPKEISRFAEDLYAGFQMLNLKNDSLRRRFDSIKYDIKKIEEVQYDLRVRGLIA